MPSRREIANRSCRFQADQLLRLLGRGGNMRRRDYLRQLRQRPVVGRLGFKDVERGGSDNASLNRSAQRVLVDEITARRVDETQTRLAAHEPRLVEQMSCVARRRQVKREVIG